MSRKQDYERVVSWARNLLQRKDWVILDTETTGLYAAEICQIAVVNHDKDVLLDTLIKPQNRIPKQATSIHGITNEQVKDSCSFENIYPELCEVIKDKLVLIYNSNFDLTILQYCCKLSGLEFPQIQSDCVMSAYSTFVGDWSDYHQGYKWQKLYGGDHSALGDCLATHNVILEMAGALPLAPRVLEDAEDQIQLPF